MPLVKSWQSPFLVHKRVAVVGRESAPGGHLSFLPAPEDEIPRASAGVAHLLRSDAGSVGRDEARFSV